MNTNQREIKKALVIVNFAKDKAAGIGEEICAYLREQKIAVTLVRFSDSPELADLSSYDIAFSLGGDGTVLYSARLLSPCEIPIVAVNVGDFGFITEVLMDEWQQTFEQYREGKLGVSKRSMLRTTVWRAGKEVARFSSLNDSVISSQGISKLVRLKVSLLGTDLGRYRADGVIVSTPTGSTAYSAAAGGPILDPEMPAIILNPICPFTLSNRPLVLKGNEVINIDVEEGQRTGVILTIDGQDVFELVEHDRVCFCISENPAKIIRSEKRSFFEVLRSKLNWSGGPDA